MPAKLMPLLIVSFLLSGPIRPQGHVRTQFDCFENLQLRRELPSIVLGCELPGCYPGYDGSTDYQMTVRFRDDLEGVLSLRLPESREANPNEFELKRGEATLADGRTIRMTSGEVEIAYSIPRDSEQRLVIVPRIDRAERPPIPDSPGLEAGQLLEVVQRVNGVRINQYRDVYVFRRCRLPKELDIFPVEPAVSVDPSVARTALPGTTLDAIEQDRVTISNIDDRELLVMVRGFQLIGSDQKCRLRLHRVSPKSDIQEFTIGNLLVNAAACPAVIAVFGDNHAPTMMTGLSPTEESDDFGSLRLEPLVQLPITISQSGSHSSNTISFEDRIFCEVAVANHIYQTFKAGVRLRPTIISGSSIATLQTMEGSAGICADLSQEFQAVPGLVASYHDVEEKHGLNCRDHRFPRLNFLGRFTAPATLGHEIGHAFELCHGFSGNIDNLMTPRRRERNIYIGQAFWANFSANSFLRPAVQGNGAFCCLERDRAGNCPRLQLDPEEFCRTQMNTSTVCPSQTVPFEVEDTRSLPERQQDMLLEWLACYDCDPSFLDDEILQGEVDLMGDFLMNVFLRRSHTQEDSLSTYLDDLYPAIRDDCPLSGLDFKRLYRANESGQRLFQAASALTLLLPAEEIGALFERQDLSSELKDVLRRAVAFHDIKL